MQKRKFLLLNIILVFAFILGINFIPTPSRIPPTCREMKRIFESFPRCLIPREKVGGFILASENDEQLLVGKNVTKKSDYKKGEIIVKFKKNIIKGSALSLEVSPKKIKYNSLKALNNKYKAKKLVRLKRTGKSLKLKTEAKELTPTKGVKRPNLNNLYKIVLGKNADIAAAIEEYSQNEYVSYAEPNVKLEAFLLPNDPYYNSSGTWFQSYDDLWGLKKINTAGGWDKNTGSSSVVAAVIDTGVDRNHEDLSANTWANSNEIPNNNLDDDSNGYVDDYYGYDFFNDDANPIDDHGHGTHVAGTISAVTNNEKGVAGVSWNSKIMAVKFLSSGGYGYLSDAILGIQYAADNGAKVLNNSWGGWGTSHSLQEAINYAYSKGAVVVAAAGNSNYDASYYQPAGLNNVFTVAATMYDDTKAWFSNYGSKVDVAAPGVDILSLRATGTSMGSVVGGKYTRASGTSMASPHVAGLAALVFADNPSYSNQQVENVIRSYSDDLGDSDFDIYFGYGRINAFRALGSVEAEISSSLSSISAINQSLTVGGSTEIKVKVMDVNDAVVSGKLVRLTTSLGSLGESSGYTNGEGEFSTTLTSAAPGEAVAEAVVAQKNIGSVKVTFTPQVDTTPPDKVLGLAAVAGDKSAILYWTKPESSDLAGILVKRSSNGYPANKDAGLLVYDGLGESVVDIGLENDKTYYCSVFSYDTTGNYSEAEKTTVIPKAIKEEKKEDKKELKDDIPPAPVKKFKVKQKDSSVLLFWVNPEDNDFEGVVIRKSKNGFPVTYKSGKKVYQGIGKEKGEMRKILDKKLKRGATYYYSIFAFDGNGNYSIMKKIRIKVK